MLKYVKQAFEQKGILLPLTCMVPSKPVTEAMRKSAKYACIEATLKVDSNVIQPVVIYPCDENGPDSGKFWILDGHMRWDILNKLNVEEVDCIISTDDEGYTYNHKINRVSTIQGHFMIMKLINEGISEERIALALNVNVAKIKEQRNLLRDICKESVSILKDKNIGEKTLSHLRKVKPVRQVVICTMMRDSKNYSEAFVKALVLNTPKEQWVNPPKQKKMRPKEFDGADNLQVELDRLEKDHTHVKEEYQNAVYKFMLARLYIAGLMNNANVVRYLAEHHNAIFSEFNNIIETLVPEKKKHIKL